VKLKDIFINKTSEQRLYQSNCPVIGLTGGIATGKSSVSTKFQELGLKVICADKLVKDIYNLDETFEFINLHFPNVIEEKKINFKSLREIAFSNEQSKKELEDFIYQRLPTAFDTELNTLGPIDVLVYDVPLLFEKNMSDKFDVTICVYTKESLQIERLIKRDSTTQELAKKIISNQLPIDKKKELSDFTIDNQKGHDHLELEVEALSTILFE
jgi:dephospho-CoA kinase